LKRDHFLIYEKFSFTKCGSNRYFSSSLAVLIKNAASPLAGESQNQAGSFSPPKAAKFVRTIFNIEHISVKVNDLWAASLRSAAKLKGNFQ